MTEEHQGTTSKTDSTAHTGARKILANPWVRGFAVVVLLGVIVLVSLPYGISFGLEKWFKSVGATDVQVEDIDFNPFTGRLHVKNLQATGERGGNIRMDQARFDFAWLPLWNKQFLLEAISLEEGEILVKREPEGGWVVGVVNLAGTDTKEDPTEPTEWQVGLRQIDVGNTKVILALPEFQSEFQINKARIDRAVAWEPENPAGVDLDFTLDGAPLSLQGKVFPFRDIPEAEGHLTAEGVNIERYQALVGPALAKLVGSTSADIQFKVVAGEEFTVSKEGGIQIQGLALAGEGIDLSQEQLSWNGAVNLQVSDTGQSVNGDGQLELQGVRVALPEQSIDQESLSYQGNFTVDLKGGEAIPAVNSEGTLSGGKLSVSLPQSGAELTQGTMTWGGKINITEDNAGVLLVTSDGKLEIDSIGIQLPDQSVEEGKLSWQGVANVTMAESPDDSRVEAEGDLVSAGFSLGGKESALSLTQSEMTWKGKVAVTGFGDNMVVTADGKMQAGDTQFENPDISVLQSLADWKGTVTFESRASGEPRITAKGGLGLGAADARLKREKLRFAHKNLRWEGQFGGEGASGGLQMDAVALTAPDKELVLVSAERVSLGGLKAPGPSSVDIGDIQVSGFAAAVPKGADTGNGLARAKTISVSGLQWRAASHTAIDAVAIDSLQASLIRTAEGGWSRIDAMRSATAGPESAPPPAAEEPEVSPPGSAGKSGAVAIGKLSITGDSRLLYQDNAVNPAASFDLAIEEAELGAMDNRQPGQATPLRLAGLLGGDSRISAEGQIKPFARPFEADLNGKISNLAVQSFSPYAAETISYQLTKGRMTATMAFKTEGGKIEGDNQFIFNELEVEAVPGDEKKLTVPLETGLAMLRDKDDRIKLKVPVSGDLDNPDFSVADAVNQALLKATQKAAVGYLALTLQPWGAVLLAADLAKDFGPGATASLDPVIFAAGSAALKPEFNDYLGKLAKIVDERPGVQLRLCGRAVKADSAKPAAAPPPPPPEEKKSRWKKLFSKDQEKKQPVEAKPAPVATDLGALATERATAVLNALVEKHKVPEDRVYTCDPTPNPEDEGEPRVDVGI